MVDKDMGDAVPARSGAPSGLSPEDGSQAKPPATIAGPVRIRLSRKKGWRKPDNTVVVSRPGLLGNPFIVGKDGTREECCNLYRHLLAGRVCLTNGPSVAEQLLHREAVMRELPRLRGANLACWCRNDGKPCHADVLLELANGT